MKTTNTEELKQNGDFAKTLVWYIQHANSTEEAEEHVRRFLTTSIHQAIAEDRERIMKQTREIISKHNANILNEFQLQGTPDMPLIAYNERVCLIPAMEKANVKLDDLLSSLDKPLPDKE